MKITLTTKPLAEKCDALVVGATREKDIVKLSPAAAKIDKTLGGVISAAVADGEFSGKAGAIFTARQGRPVRPGRPARNSAPLFGKVVVVGLGGGSTREIRQGIDAAARAALAARAARAPLAANAGLADLARLVTRGGHGNDSPRAVVFALTAEAPLAAGDWADIVAVACARAGHRFHLDDSPSDSICRQAVVAVAKRDAAAESSRRLAEALAFGMRWTLHLAELPGNYCDPPFLGETAKRLARQLKLRAVVMDEGKIKKIGMRALWAVGKGSARPSRFIKLRHDGGGKSAPLALVGKGVTFDTGGISLKPAGAMDEMKFDMCGAAAVFGALAACAQANLPLNVVGLIPACENMPDGRAIKPGDITQSLAGKTIEVLNTDAEGRLILADALSYAARLRPAAIVDAATLTGACVVALGREASGLLSGDDELATELAARGEESGDYCWRLPLWREYQDMLKSDFADVANIGGREAGTITAACFLSRFAEGQKWAHLDIAGSAWNKKKRATGRPLPLLLRFLVARARTQTRK